MKYILFSCLILVGLISVHAQDTAKTYQEISLAAYLQNDLELWDEALAIISELPASTDRSLALAQTAYGALGTAFSREKPAEVAIPYLDLAQTELEEVLDEDRQNATAHGLLSGVLGMRIGLDPSLGMSLGQRSNTHAAKGLRFGPENSIALFHGGSQQLYTPVQWGGDPERAVELISKAEAAFDKTLAGQDWRYLSILALQGQALAMTDQKEAARSVYLRALALQPEFGYVKHFLLPALDAE